MIGECPRCGSGSVLKLDVKQNKVICEQCQKEVKGLSPFMITNMRQQGDTVKNEEKIKVPEGGIIAECKKCGAKSSAELNRKDHKAYCTECDTDLGLTELMTQLLKENGIYSKKVKTRIVNPEDGDLDMGNNIIDRKNSEAKAKPKVNILTGSDGEPAKKKRGRPAKVPA
jgi:transcription elongation factor Elf1